MVNYGLRHVAADHVALAGASLCKNFLPGISVIRVNSAPAACSQVTSELLYVIAVVVCWFGSASSSPKTPSRGRAGYPVRISGECSGSGPDNRACAPNAHSAYPAPTQKLMHNLRGLTGLSVEKMVFSTILVTEVYFRHTRVRRQAMARIYRA